MKLWLGIWLVLTIVVAVRYGQSAWRWADGYGLFAWIRAAFGVVAVLFLLAVLAMSLAYAWDWLCPRAWGWFLLACRWIGQTIMAAP